MENAAPEATSDPVARVLLPVLLHEVNNATQLLVGLRAILEIPGGEAMFHQRADDLARTSATMDDLGFALAVVATAGGANMLLARRDARSVRILWDLGVKAVCREHPGARLEVVGEPPLTVPSALDGWQLAWSVAAVLIAAVGDRGERLNEWSFHWSSAGEEGPVQLICQPKAAVEGALGPFDDGLLLRLNERLAPDGRVEVKDGAVVWSGDASLFSN